MLNEGERPMLSLSNSRERCRLSKDTVHHRAESVRAQDRVAPHVKHERNRIGNRHFAKLVAPLWIVAAKRRICGHCCVTAMNHHPVTVAGFNEASRLFSRKTSMKESAERTNERHVP